MKNTEAEILFQPEAFLHISFQMNDLVMLMNGKSWAGYQDEE